MIEMKKEKNEKWGIFQCPWINLRMKYATESGNSIMEQKIVEKELSQLIELTLRLEDELNSIVKYE